MPLDPAPRARRRPVCHAARSSAAASPAPAARGRGLARCSPTRGRRSPPSQTARRHPVLSSDLYASPDPQRFVARARSAAAPSGIKYVSGPPVEVRFRPPTAPGSRGRRSLTALDRVGPAQGPRRVPQRLARSAQPGSGTVEAELRGRDDRRSRCQLPGHRGGAGRPGQAAPRAASPTTPTPSASTRSAPASPRARCTPCRCRRRRAPGKPVAVLFATPALLRVGSTAGRCSTRCSTSWSPYEDRRDLRARRHLQEPDRHRAVAHGRGVARCRASRGSSASTAPAPSGRARHRVRRRPR